MAKMTLKELSICKVRSVGPEFLTLKIRKYSEILSGHI